jgi:hypothetical protein
MLPNQSYRSSQNSLQSTHKLLAVFGGNHRSQLTEMAEPIMPTDPAATLENVTEMRHIGRPLLTTI